MILRILVNGREDQQSFPLDRGLFYGQTVFETIAVVNGRPALMEEHLARMSKGCKRIGIPLNINYLIDDIKVISNNILERSYVLRLTVSMGVGGRGYKNPDDPTPTRIVSLHDYPKRPSQLGIRIGISEVALAYQPLLAGIKHGNRIEQVLARQSWHDDWDEALLLDYQGNVIEGTQSNLFIVKNGDIKTPLLDGSGVEGVMRNWVISNLNAAGFSCSAVRLSVSDVINADEVFLTNSVLGIQSVAVLQINEQQIDYSTAPIANTLLTTLLEHDLISAI